MSESELAEGHHASIGKTVYLPDQRDVVISRFGSGNVKIGDGVFTYSRLAGGAETCPGASEWCEAKCYAKRIHGPTEEVYAINSATDDVPPIPDECHTLRLHVSGDFDSVRYVMNWHKRLTERRDVSAWGYTRSWNKPYLLPALEELRALSNLQLFASTDKTMPAPPHGWRVAWIAGDPRSQGLVCPEETGGKQDCVECKYCFVGQVSDVIFLEH